MENEPNKNKYYRQLILVALLVVFPIIMIIVNGTRAVEGILWTPKQLQTEYSDSVQDRTAKIEGENQFLFGIYEPGHRPSSTFNWDLRHVYISWLQFHPDSLRITLQNIIDKNTTPVLTVEPWNKNEQALMPSILNGDYDKEMEQLKASLMQLSDTILISWGHEMDQDLTERYPWSDTDPELFVQAYKYVFDYLESTELKIKWIWAPVAKKNSHEYWPGDKYVDIVGIPIYSFPEWDQQTFGFIRSFRASLGEKYSILSSFNKPIYILEFGVTGSSDFKGYWLHQAFLELNEFPLLKGLIFFNSKDTPGAWGANVSTPDWRVDTTMVHALVDWYDTYH